MRRILLVVAAIFAAATTLAAPPEWVTRAAAIPTPEYAKTSRAVVLLDSTTVDLTAGPIVTRHRRVIRLLGNHVRDLALPSAVYDDDTQLTMFQGWTSTKGEWRDVRFRDAIESSPWGELYNDARVKTLQFPSTDVGTIIAWESEEHSRSDFLQTTWSFQGELPRVTAELTLQLPQVLSYEAHWFQHEEVKPVSGPPTVVWRLQDVRGVDEEPHMPEWEAVAGRLGIRITGLANDDHQTWNGIARWFNNLAIERCVASPQMQAKARELAPAAMAPLDKIRAIAKFAQRDVRYVAIEIGIGGYQPHPAADVFAKRYGDCKDKVTLLRTMLREAGVESYYVVVNATRGVVDPAFPTITAFNHVIAAIPISSATPDLYTTIDHPKLGKLLLFDPTSTATPFGLLPLDEQGGHALLVTGDGGELIKLPVAPAKANQLRRRATLQLDADGTLHGDIEEVRSGSMAAELRSALRGKTDAARVEYMNSMAGAHLARPEVSGLTFEHVDDSSGDVVVRYKLVARDYVSHAASMTLVRPRVLGQKADLQVDVTRKHPYVTDGPALHVDDVEIAIPATLKLDELPPAVTLSIAPFTYTSESKFDGTKLTYHREYTLNTGVLTSAQLPEVNKAYAKIASDERSTAVFVAK